MPTIKSIYSSKHSNIVDFSNFPDFREVRKKILDSPLPPEQWHKPCFAILLITGCRVSELLALRKKDIVWTDENKNPVEPVEDMSNVRIVYFNLITLKRRGANKPMRRFPVLNDVRYSGLLKIVFDYWLCCPYEDTMLFEGKYRLKVWYAMKRHLDKEYYPHMLRHVSASYYAQNGVIGAGLKKRFGWAKETSAEPYVNLSDDYLLDKERELSKSFVDIKEVKEVKKKVEEVKIVPKPKLVASKKSFGLGVEKDFEVVF